MKNPPIHDKSKAAFTLVELLVVIVIIAVLAGLVFTISGGVRTKASAAVSASNLRQIGIAMNAYGSDNNNKLPGPILTDHFASYQNNAISGQLGWVLRDYLTAEPRPDDPLPRTFYLSTLDYPAAKTGPSNRRATYMVFANPLDTITKSRVLPLGNYNPNSSGERTPAMNVNQFSTVTVRKQPWITELDQVIRPSTSRYGTPEKPAHGKFRNSLMFDFSVKAIPVAEFDSSWK